ncbi:MAG: helix-turn-helix transcriptional regulator [Clostridiales bacterium]|nr:helix-turn-helix transcriptional regulator [Clostridiales bacterium]
MNINELLKQKGITKYRLSKTSGVPFTTISEITTGKSKIKNCTGDTLYRIAKSLDVTIEELLADSMEYRQGFEAYKSNICHAVKDLGDIDFIIATLESDTIRKLYQRRWYPESLYLLAMVDYLSRLNGLPACAQYNDIRAVKLKETIYPASILTLSAALKSDAPKTDSIREAIPEFMRFNIVESEVRDVC